MENASERLIKIRETLDGIACETGIPVEIVAATKTRQIDEILTLKDTGISFVAGENRVQEMLTKYTDALTWDMIGRLQANKVKYIIDKVRLIHSVDRTSLLEEINRQANKHDKIQEALIEINLGREADKGGIFLEDVEGFLAEAVAYKNVKLVGLMCVAPLVVTPTELAGMFDAGYNQYVRYKDVAGFKYLSMGMSNDYILAAKAGANMVRIGRGIFGERNS